MSRFPRDPREFIDESKRAARRPSGVVQQERRGFIDRRWRRQRRRQDLLMVMGNPVLSRVRFPGHIDCYLVDQLYSAEEKRKRERKTRMARIFIDGRPQRI